MAGDKAGVIYWYVVSALSRDLSAQTLEGGPLMPALAELAQGAVRFESALACSGDSFLSTASMLTGKWPSRLGLTDCRVRVMGRGLEQLGGLDSAHATLPAWLAKQGFDTFSHPDSLTPFPGDGLEQGFTHPKAMPQALEEDRSIFIWHQAKGCRLPLEPTGLARRALGLEDQADQQGLYLAAAFDADRALARDLGELAQAGLWDRALIVVTSDCGPGPAPGQGGDRPHRTPWPKPGRAPVHQVSGRPPLGRAPRPNDQDQGRSGRPGPPPWPWPARAKTCRTRTAGASCRLSPERTGSTGTWWPSDPSWSRTNKDR